MIVTVDRHLIWSFGSSLLQELCSCLVDCAPLRLFAHDKTEAPSLDCRFCSGSVRCQWLQDVLTVTGEGIATMQRRRVQLEEKGRCAWQLCQ